MRLMKAVTVEHSCGVSIGGNPVNHRDEYQNPFEVVPAPLSSRRIYALAPQKQVYIGQDVAIREHDDRNNMLPELSWC